MPKIVDHEQRRREIAAAVCSIAAREGLEAVSLRRVAAEAGISPPLVAHYFTDKPAMLLFAVNDLTASNARLVEQRISDTVRDDPGNAVRALIRCFAVEALPLDERRRTFLLVHLTFFVRALQDPAVSSIYRDESPALTNTLTFELGRQQDEGRVPAHLDTRREAETLTALIMQLGPEMLAGTRTEESALGLVDYHLDRLFPLTH